MKMRFTSLTYPDATFADLHHLESLIIDGAGEPVFGPGFAQMRRLKSLSFGSQCLIRRLGKNSFVNFREAPVRDLSLSACSILIFLDANVFFPLHKLKFLLARETAPFGLDESLLSLKGLSGRNMTEIDFSLVRTYPVSVQGVMKNQSLVLTSEMTRYLKTMCVERLILRNNYIVVIESSVLLQEPFQSCIKYIDISYNSIKGDPSWLFRLPELVNLAVLDVSNQAYILDAGDGQYQHSKDIPKLTFFGNMTLFLPPSLEKLLLSGSGAHGRSLEGTNMCFLGGNNLWYLDLSYSAIITKTSRVFGLEHVKYLDFSGNFFKKIPLTFFQSFPIVMTLYLKNVHFDTDLMSNMSSQTLFSPLKNVHLLDWVCTTFLQKVEVQRGLRLCIPDRDFDVGVCAAEEIINCIHNSWKTVLYVTETFLQDEMCSFTLSSGVYACNNNMPKRLMLLYSDTILHHPLPPLLTQLLDGANVFVLEELEEKRAWQQFFELVLKWI
ncbi:uncharacterized protein LOC124285767 [Haliotis rubra]|uniref:uncharacterized protein LOC124285767 n=1 Tax=Haliotis rubra TaxID=36100 RepID=UPI001EE4ECD4|nr:uncharacterized protein LOC124285767 [Haliotis rubra]